MYFSRLRPDQVSGLWLIRKVLSRRHAARTDTATKYLARESSQRFIGFLHNAVVVWVLCRIGCFLWNVERRKGRGERHGKTLDLRCIGLRELRTEIYSGVHTGSSTADCTAELMPHNPGSVYLSCRIIISMVVLASIDPDMKNLVDQVILIKKREFVIPEIWDSVFAKIRICNPENTGFQVCQSRDYGI